MTNVTNGKSSLPFETEYDFPVLSQINLMDILFPNYWEDCLFSVVSYDEETAKIKAWVTENNFHFYAKPSESFSVNEAISQAQALGKVGVVVDNLS